MNASGKFTPTQIQSQFLWRFRGLLHKLFTRFQKGMNLLQIQRPIVKTDLVHLPLEKMGILYPANVQSYPRIIQVGGCNGSGGDLETVDVHSCLILAPPYHRRHVLPGVCPEGSALCSYRPIGLIGRIDCLNPQHPPLQHVHIPAMHPVVSTQANDARLPQLAWIYPQSHGEVPLPHVHQGIARDHHRIILPIQRNCFPSLANR